MTKSDLIGRLIAKHEQLPTRDIDEATKLVLDKMITTLIQAKKRIEIRGFGSFSLHSRNPRNGRNPRTGEIVPLARKFAVHFKPGKELRERVNSINSSEIISEPSNVENNLDNI